MPFLKNTRIQPKLLEKWPKSHRQAINYTACIITQTLNRLKLTQYGEPCPSNGGEIYAMQPWEWAVNFLYLLISNCGYEWSRMLIKNQSKKPWARLIEIGEGFHFLLQTPTSTDWYQLCNHASPKKTTSMQKCFFKISLYNKSHATTGCSDTADSIVSQMQ